MSHRRALTLLALSAFGCRVPSPETGAALRDAESPLDAEVEDAGIADAVVEDAVPDAPPPLDAPADVQVPDASHWCGTQEFIFCDDFDEYSLAQGWDATDDQSGSLTLDDSAYTSPAYSFVATTTAVGVDGLALARLQKRVADEVREIQFAFDLRLDLVDPSGASVIVTTIELATAAGTSIDTLNLVLRAGGASLDDVGPSGDAGGSFTASYPLSPAPALGVWTHVEIDLELASDGGLGGGSTTVYLGNAPQPSLDHAPMSPASQPALPFFFLGSGVVGPSGPMAVRFDNVTLNFE